MRSIQRAGHWIGAAFVVVDASSTPSERSAAVAGDGAFLDKPASGSLREIERDLLLRTLEACGGNTSAAARRLGINRSTIYRRIKPSHRN
jgi:transcriptional regulator of acetoin/glycerol metabolism